MTQALKMVWIDDDPGRVSANGWDKILRDGVDSLDATGVLEVFPVSEKVLEFLDDWAQRVHDAPPDLVLLDHNLSRVPSRQFGIKGSSLAHLLRLRLPKTPIVCVTAQEVESHDFDFEDLSEYTQVFSFSRLSNSDQLEALFVVAKDYPRVCVSEALSARKAILDALAPPAYDRDSLFAVMPEEFEGRVVHGTTPHRIARWIINVLMSRPGFLSDQLDVATYLGLSEAAFLTKAKALFDSAKYTGPFATPSRPRWWTSALNDVLYTHLPDHTGLPPQRAGRRLTGVVAEDFSSCFVSETVEPPPDIVAFTDEHGNERRQVRRQFTEPFAPDSMLGFAPRLRIHDDRPRG